MNCQPQPDPGFPSAPFLTRIPGPVGLKAYKRWKTERAAEALEAFSARLATLGPEDICLDLGANVGKFTEVLARTGAHVLAFEPDPETCAVLTESIANYENVEIRNEAIGVVDGSVVLYRAKNYADNKLAKSLGASTVRNDRFAMDRSNTVTVKQVDFFDLVQSFGKPVSLVKMDIEGAEWPILEGVAAGRAAGYIDSMFVETHERFNSWKLIPLVHQLNDAFAKLDRPVVNTFWV